jgi:hypothetical protein
VAGGGILVGLGLWRALKVGANLGEADKRALLSPLAEVDDDVFSRR